MSTKPLPFLNRWLNFTQLALWPGMCICCVRPSGLSVDLCESCRNVLPRVEAPCPGCGLPLPLGHPPGVRCGACSVRSRPIYRIRAPFAWRTPVSSLISGFKYHERLHYGRVLASQWLEELDEAHREEELPELLIPVPLHPRRLRQRGYNQALLLAQQWGAVLDIPVATSIVARVRDTPAQQGLDAAHRKRNLKKAFIVKEPQVLADYRRVALVDDVLTTMSTVDTLARVIRKAAPHELEIHAWALARA